MNFEEKIDAMRTTLELAIHDIEAQRAGMQEVRASIQELRMVSERQHESIQELRGSVQELRMLSEHQHESIEGLMKISGELVQAVTLHDKRIGVIEGRPNA